MSRSPVPGALIALAVAAACPAVVHAGPDPSAKQPADASGAEARVLRLPEALALALESSPGLAPFSFDVRAAEARELQAGLLPNPKVELSVEDVAGSGDLEGGRQAETTLQLSQLVELGGKRAARVAAAGRSADVSRAAYEERRVEVLAEVAARFLDLLERQRRLDLASEGVRIDRRTLREVKRRVGAGAGSPLEEKRAETAVARSRLEAEDALHEVAVAKTALAATWGAPVPPFERVEGDLFARGSVPAWADLERSLGRAPELRRRATEERLREAELRLARTRRIPDLAVAAGPRRVERSDDHALVFGFSVPLPVFDQNQGGIDEARARAGRSGAEWTAAEVRLRALLYRLWQEVEHAEHVLEVLEREVLPASEAALRISRRGFERGRFSHLELLDARRAFLDARSRRIEAAASFHRFVLEIEKVTGAPIETPEPDAGPGDAP